jgi:hypothetical protein
MCWYIKPKDAKESKGGKNIYSIPEGVAKLRRTKQLPNLWNAPGNNRDQGKTEGDPWGK